MSATRGEPVTCAFIEGGTGPGTLRSRHSYVGRLNRSRSGRTP